VANLTRSFAFLVLIASGLALSGCGFHPMYGSGSVGTSTINDLASITVNTPGTRVGRALKFDLLDTMNGRGEQPTSPAYVLQLNPTNYSQDLAIQQDASVTRSNYVLVVPFTLTSIETGKIVYRATSRGRSSYNKVESEFANLSAAEDAAERTAKSVAADIKTQLSVFFDRRNSTDKTASR
tara:strand:+ start:35852 stop:36394 length:543 start_codon:yes stop_codon:yes gene_type:complete